MISRRAPPGVPADEWRLVRLADRLAATLRRNLEPVGPGNLAVRLDDLASLCARRVRIVWR